MNELHTYMWQSQVDIQTVKIASSCGSEIYCTCMYSIAQERVISMEHSLDIIK